MKSRSGEFDLRPRKEIGNGSHIWPTIRKFQERIFLVYGHEKD